MYAAVAQAATFTVTNGNDSGPGSLRQAVNEANDHADANNTINVASPFADGKDSIVLQSGYGTTGDDAQSCLVIRAGKSVTLNGNSVAISGGGNGWRLFFVVNGATLNVERVHFRNVKMTLPGGGILNRGTLSVKSCIFSNLDIGGSYGGALTHGNPSVAFTVSGCTFVNNKAGFGGAITMQGGCGTDVKIVGNLFYNNTASATTIGGAAVWMNTGNSATINPLCSYNVWDKQDNSNAGDWRPPTGSPNFNKRQDPLTTWVSGYTPTIVGATGTHMDILPSSLSGFPTTDFYGNTRVFPNGIVGAIATRVVVDVTNGNDAGTGSLRAAVDAINNTTIAYPNFIINIKSPFSGGSDSIRLANPGDNGTNKSCLVIKPNKNVTIYGNSAAISGGGNGYRLFMVENNATLNVERVHFRNVKAISLAGGAICNRGTVNVKSCIFSNLDIGTTSTASDEQSWSIGGAILHTFTGTALTVSGCTFVGNYSQQGGAIVKWVSSGTAFKIVGNLFYNNNTATNSASAVWISNLDTDDPTVLNSLCSYNVWDKQDDLGNDWRPTGAGNKRKDPLTAWVSGYTPVSDSLNIVAGGLADFPTTDFYGSPRALSNATVGAIQKNIDFFV
ncbi:hypothetical protein FACS189456_2190 [Bacteroidia bacterium]|nr:hypothetical protein FACS189456_2190 [Bacteroidia bacterium]